MSEPKFVTLEDENKMFHVEKNYNRHLFIQGSSDGSRVNEFVMCSVVVTHGSNFYGNWAFGAGMASGSGGAIFITYSNLLVENVCGFENNIAAVGGAVCTLASVAYFNEPCFDGNTAIKYGGAFYFQGVFVEVYDHLSEDHVFYQTGGNYLNNTAYSLGGAICFSMAGTSSLQDVGFEYNSASLNGGAIASVFASMRMFACKFLNNTSGVGDYNQNMTMSRRTAPAFGGRGGGAIFFASGAKNYENAKILYTSNSCFSNNTAYNSVKFNDTVGHALLFDGTVKWFSHTDTISGYNTNNISYIGFTDRNQLEMPNMDIRDSSEGCNSSEMGDFETSYYHKINISRSTYQNPTTYIPVPTTFTYQATMPITYHTINFSKYTHPTMNNSFSTPSMPTTISSSVSQSTEIQSPTPYATFVPSETQVATLIPSETQSSTSKPSETQSSTNEQSETESSTTEQSTTSYYTQRSINFSLRTTTITTITEISISTISYWNTTTKSIYMSDSINHTTMIIIPISTLIITVTNTSVIMIINSEITESDPGDTMDDMLILIAAAAAGSIIVLIIISVIICYLVKRKNEETSESTVEMNEETVIQIDTNMLPNITNDNPLWTTSVMGDSDDPFRNDFEEETCVGYLVKETLSDYEKSESTK